jgi:hypothetical protein
MHAATVATVDGATGGQISGKVTIAGVGDGVEIQGPGIGNANEAYIRFGDQSGTQFGYVGDANPGNPDMYVVAHTGAIHLYTAGGTTLTATSTGRVAIGGNSVVQNGRLAVVEVAGASPGYAINAICQADDGVAVLAQASSAPSGIGIYADGSQLAGYFEGDVDVQGTLTKDAGSFKIDHPLDPANKYLSHSFVESPDMKNIYDGIAILDAKGEATIALPDWFGALNKEFRYQLTAIGAPGPGLYIAQEITGDRFRIAGGSKGMKVSWQVTGIRKDAYANAHRIPVEEAKSEKERGYYRNPELFNQPEEKGLEWALHPEMMKEMKGQREKTKAEK